MLTKAVIESLYKKYDKRPSSPDELDIGLLFEHLLDSHDVMIDDHARLIINSLPPSSPFHALPLRNIHAIVNFEDEVAIVLHSSVIILDKNTSKVYINLRPRTNSLTERLSSIFRRTADDDEE